MVGRERNQEGLLTVRASQWVVRQRGKCCFMLVLGPWVRTEGKLESECETQKKGATHSVERRLDHFGV